MVQGDPVWVVVVGAGSGGGDGQRYGWSFQALSK
jgi:hypothetical protein